MGPPPKDSPPERKTVTVGRQSTWGRRSWIPFQILGKILVFFENWKGKIGYGDIISPISYAYNMAEKNSTDVILKFHWKDSKPQKYKEIKNPQDRFLADPFVFSKNNRSIIYVEDYSFEKKKGEV